MKIKTEIAKEMISKVYKGVGNNKIIPITGFISVIVENKTFYFISTTGQSQVIARNQTDEQDFSVSVRADILYSLIQKTTSEFIVFSIEGNGLEIVGNGKYLLDIPVDENGDVIIIKPNRVDTTAKAHKIDMKVLRNCLNIHKPSVAETIDMYSLTGFYFSTENVITTNAFVACVSHEKYFSDEPLLIPYEVVQLFDVFGDNKVEFFIDKNLNFEVRTAEVILCARLMDEVSEYPVGAVLKLVDSKVNSSISIDKKILMEAVSRVNLFVDEFDKNAVKLTFTKNNLQLDNLKNSGHENVVTISTDIKEQFAITVNIVLFENQLNAYPGEKVQMNIDSKNSIKLISENRTQIIATLIDEGENQ